MKIKFVEGTRVLHEVERVLAVDVKAIVPQWGDEVVIPRRKVKRVATVRYRYGKRGLLGVEVVLVDVRRG